MSYIRTRRSDVQARSHATAPRASDGGLTTAARVESRNTKRCRSRAFSAIISSTRPTRMTQRQWRRSDRAFRSRDLDLHRTLTGRLREHRRGDFEGTVGGYNVDRSASRARYISDTRSKRRGPVAALDGLKNENFCCDHNILINPAAKRPSATLSAIVHPLSVSDAEELSLKPREALERRKCRPLTTRAEHALREVDLAIVLGRHMRQSDGSHCTTACTTIECNGPRLV